MASSDRMFINNDENIFENIMINYEMCSNKQDNKLLPDCGCDCHIARS